MKYNNDEFAGYIQYFEPLTIEEQKLLCFICLHTMDEFTEKFEQKKNDKESFKLVFSTYEMIANLFTRSEFDKIMGKSLKNTLLHDYAKEEYERYLAEKERKTC